MTDDRTLAELRDLTRALRAHVRRLEDSGALGVPRGAWPTVARPADAPIAVAPAIAPSAVAPVPSAPVGGAAPTAPKAERGPGLALPERLGVLAALSEEVAACRKCRLYEGRTRSVFARGSPSARLMFVGEGPGRDEDLQGAPFVGKAGQLLDKMIAAMGLDAEQVYICNVVKCRPPNNRVPMADEAAACEPYLTRQIDVVRPEVIVALGKTAVSFLLGLDEPMARLRGRWFVFRDTPVMPTFHPAFLLRSPEYKREVWDDLKLVLARLGLRPPARGGS